MGGLHTVAADVKFGPGITLQGLTLSSATTRVQLPGQSDTVLKVKQGDFLVALRVVTTRGHVFLRLPFSQFTGPSASQPAPVPHPPPPPPPHPPPPPPPPPLTPPTHP